MILVQVLAAADHGATSEPMDPDAGPSTATTEGPLPFSLFVPFDFEFAILAGSLVGSFFEPLEEKLLEGFFETSFVADFEPDFELGFVEELLVVVFAKAFEAGNAMDNSVGIINAIATAGAPKLLLDFLSSLCFKPRLLVRVGTKTHLSFVPIGPSPRSPEDLRGSWFETGLSSYQELA